jgi:hypothetical protein
MTRGRKPGPMGRTGNLDLTITGDDFDRALGSQTHSGRCMIAQAITAKFGPGSRPIVDSDYIRLTNPANGDRLLYRTPPDAAAALKSFDAGIKPPLPLRINARISFQKRHHRPAHEAQIREVREWAKSQPQFAGTSVGGSLSHEVVTAFKAAHPGKTVAHQGRQAVSTSGSAGVPKTVLPDGNVSTPPVGNLAGGHLKGRGRTKNVPESRRRTWGSRVLTSVLVEQGWTVPEAAEDTGKGDQS